MPPPGRRSAFRATRRGALLGLLLLGLAGVCAAQPPTGRYFNAEGRFIELRADGTFVAHPPFGEVVGTYAVRGAEVVLKFKALGFTDVCTLQGDTLTNRAGQRFVRAAGAAGGK